MYESKTRTLYESETRKIRKSRAQCTKAKGVRCAKAKRVKWTTIGEKFSTKRKALLDFSFPELAPNKNITWIMHVDVKTSKETALYDMIIGMNLMTDIKLQTKEQCNMLHELCTAIPNLQDAEERQARIAEADNRLVDLKKRKLNY